MSKWVESKRLVLRPYRLNEWRNIVKYISNREVWKFLDEVPFDEKTARQFIAYNVQQQTERDGFADHIPIILKPNFHIIGHLFLQRIYRPGLIMETGVMIDPNYQGSGYGTEALKLLINNAFEKLNIHRIVASCDTRNVAACKMLEKVGMLKEGVFMKSMLIANEWQDENFYAVLKDKWNKN